MCCTLSQKRKKKKKNAYVLREQVHSFLKILCLMQMCLLCTLVRDYKQ